MWRAKIDRLEGRACKIFIAQGQAAKQRRARKPQLSALKVRQVIRGVDRHVCFGKSSQHFILRQQFQLARNSPVKDAAEKERCAFGVADYGIILFARDGANGWKSIETRTAA